MKPMEKLARRICWVEFNGMSPKMLGTTEARYWAALPIETKERYHDEARRLCWAMNALMRSPGGFVLLSDARGISREAA